VIVEPGCNISEGRNVAIRRATGDVIVSTDAGVRFGRDWLGELLSPFAASPVPMWSAASSSRTGNDVRSGNGRDSPAALEEVRPDRFLPSSRSVAFRKAAWEAVGGYPAFMSFSEDLLFDLALKNRGLRFVFAPGGRVFSSALQPGRVLAAVPQLRNGRRRGVAVDQTPCHPLWHISGGVTRADVRGCCLEPVVLGAHRSRRGPLPAPALRTIVPALAWFAAAEKVRAALWVPVIRVWATWRRWWVIRWACRAAGGSVRGPVRTWVASN